MKLKNEAEKTGGQIRERDRDREIESVLPDGSSIHLL